MQQDPWLKGDVEEAQGHHATLVSGNRTTHSLSKWLLLIWHPWKIGLNMRASSSIVAGKVYAWATLGVSPERGGFNTMEVGITQDGLSKRWTAPLANSAHLLQFLSHAVTRTRRTLENYQNRSEFGWASFGGRAAKTVERGGDSEICPDAVRLVLVFRASHLDLSPVVLVIAQSVSPIVVRFTSRLLRLGVPPKEAHSRATSLCKKTEHPFQHSAVVHKTACRRNDPSNG